MSNEKLNTIRKLVSAINVDVYIYGGPITRAGDDKICNLSQSPSSSTEALLVLMTNGGNPDSAYKIARCLQKKYKKFTLMVPWFCKSSGTLIAVGAHELAFGTKGELGPLDIQLQQKDDLVTGSGLDVIETLKYLETKVLTMVETYFISIMRKSNNQITFKTASEIATNISTELFGNIYRQIDPLRLGEVYRSMAIATRYGERLSEVSKNISARRLDALVSGYPSHSFVIDQKEATSLFNNVRDATPNEQLLFELCLDEIIDGVSTKNPFVFFIPCPPPNQPVVPPKPALSKQAINPIPKTAIIKPSNNNGQNTN